jgi:hypothetical protein
VAFCGSCGNQLSDLAVACPKCGTPTARGAAQRGGPAPPQEYVAAPNLRPLGVGEIIDAAIKVYRSNAATLFTLTAIVVVPVQILSALILSSATTSFPVRNIGGTGATPTTTFNTSGLWTFVAATLITVGLGLISAQLATAASLRTVSEAYLGERPDWRESLQFALRRIGPLIGLSLLAGLLTGLGFLACIVPGIWLAVSWSVSVPAMLHEGTGVWSSMQRSFELVKGRWWSVAGVLLLSQLVAFILRLILSGLFGVLLTAGASNQVATFIRSAVVGSLSGVLITPFLAATIAIMYFDLRVRKEGFDLELLAQRLGRPELGSPSPAAPAAPAPRTSRRPPPRRPGFTPDDEAPEDEALEGSPEDVADEEPDEVEPDEAPPPRPPRPSRKAAPRKPAPRKPAPRKPAPRTPPPPPPPFDDEPPDDPEFHHG